MEYRNSTSLEKDANKIVLPKINNTDEQGKEKIQEEIAEVYVPDFD